MARNRKAARLQREGRRKRRNTIIVGLLLVFLMTVGILGYGNSQNTGSGSGRFVYNGFDFEAEQVNGNILFIASKDGTELGYFYSQPIEIENLNVTPEFKQVAITSPTLVFSNKPIPLDGQVNNNRVYQEILIRHVDELTNKNIQQGLTEEDAYNDAAVYDCSSATSNAPVILFDDSESKQPGIYNEDEDYCYRLVASGLDILRMRDRIIYIIIGVQ